MHSFQEYNKLLQSAVLKLDGTIKILSNGAYIVNIGDKKGKRLSVISGLHGDEISGPLSILRWLELLSIQKDTIKGKSIWLAPLINNDGWDKGDRYWNDLDLNRAFTSSPPLFINEIMEELIYLSPTIFMDLHEDSDLDFPYVFRLPEDNHNLSQRLQKELGARDMIWSFEENWEGASEVFMRLQGCHHCVTIEATPSWPLKNRILWNIKALTWCFEHLYEYSDC